MIVVVSHPGDPHAMRVVGVLEARGHEVLLLNLSELPDRARLTLDYADPSRPAVLWATADGDERDLRLANAVWWRRPQAVDLAGISDPHLQLFTANEWNEAIQGVWQLLDARWMNQPSLDDAASRKARQLKVASEVGLRAPRTLVTSDPDRARAYICEHGVERIIYKSFSCTHAVWRTTRLLRPSDLDLLDTLRLAPVIFQEFIEGDDLRITIVGDRIFPAEIRFKPGAKPVDFRPHLGDATTRPTDLPAEVHTRLRALMECLGLVYGAVDMRRTPAGEHVFLEVNTAGEFLFIEDRTGQPITDAIADWLAAVRTHASGTSERQS